jgi:hypothetical protein
MDNQKDKQLWEMAEARAGFKRHLLSYVVVNLFLVGIWFFSHSNHGTRNFWPVWPMLGWGIGLAFHYFGVYHGDAVFSAEKEYQKLKKNANS